MSQEFLIPNRLASYSEITAMMARNVQLARHREANNALLCRYAISHANLSHMSGYVALSIRWIEPTPKRNYAHVSAAVCFIERALIECGIIEPQSVVSIAHDFAVNPRRPRVEVKIMEVI